MESAVKQLGYAATWRTKCFLRDDCNEEVWAHTNGYGDFVLFDDLGWPWPVHYCYIYRFDTRPNDTPRPVTLVDEASWQQLRNNLSTEYLRKSAEIKPPPMRKIQISRAKPEDWLLRGTFQIFGYVQDYLENRVSKLLHNAGEFVRHDVRKKLGEKNSQITLVTTDSQSFTAIADLRKVIISRASLAAATLRVVRIPFFKALPIAFICDSLHVLELAPPRKARLA